MELACAALDFRSDTVTRPTPGMRQAMAAAEVGDDVFGEDPSVRRLEERVAALFGREGALLVPSGTMANLLGIGTHCGRGDELILERRTHSFSHEVGGAAALLGLSFHPLDSPDGLLSVPLVSRAIRPLDVHEPRTRLLVLENTANLCGGRVLPLARLRELRALARERGLKVHLDGARIWNAAIASGVPLATWAAEVDSLSCCLSKGLGCPVGSLLVGDREDLARARVLRKMLGGGLRQAGVLAACGLWALDHHVERLAEDHATARALAEGLAQALDGRFRVQPPETNILLVHADTPETTRRAVELWNRLGVRCFSLGETSIRLVTHLDLPPGAAEEAVRRLAAQPA
jgi:threonine aldolase